MSDNRRQLEQAIAALEAQRSLLGDAVVEAGLAPMRERLAALQAQVAPTEQRRLVTVLFADVVGFTSLAETIDAEELHKQLQALWQLLDGVILDHGGHIDKHMGDGLMALWGSSQAREDDAERAIRAALAMQSLLAQRGDDAIRLRVGINSGPVLVGSLGTVGEVTALGDTVNLASRLEHAAPPGAVLIAHDSYRHVRGIFDVEVLPPLTVRGKSDPVQVYLVKRTKPRAFFLSSRGVEGIETQMVGRTSEFAHLQEAYQSLYEGATMRAITVVGDAGLGKSRLLYEFLGWADLQPHPITLFKGRAAPQMLHLPYALLRDLFAFRFDIQESDEPPVALDKLEGGITSLLGGRSDESLMRAHFIGYLLGFDAAASPHLRGVVEDTQQVRQRALRYLGQLFSTVARVAPLLVVLEDLHWADEASLDALNHLLLEAEPAPLLLVALARPTLFERRPTWGDGYPDHSRLVLQPLSAHASQSLVVDLLRHLEEIPATLRDLVVGGAEGNPFYIEELIKMLIEAGVIVQEQQRWRVEGQQLARTRVPATLSGVLQARLDALPAHERGLLQRAAVIGRVFWDGAAMALWESPPATEEEGQLATLRQREIIFLREPSTFLGTREYLFKHALLRDVAYECTLKRQRRAYHERAARWLASWGENRTHPLAGLIAEHYAQAGNLAEAAPWYRRAAQQAQATHDLGEAMRCYEQVLAHSSPSERVEALLGLGDCCQTTGCWDAAEGHYAEAMTLAEAEGDEARLARANRALGVLRHLQGNAHEALTLLERARRGYERLGNIGGLTAVLIAFGSTYIRSGEYQTARETLERALMLAREQEDWQGAGDALNHLGTVMMRTGNYGEAQALYEESLALRRASGDQRRISGSLNNLATMHLTTGEYDAARQLWQEHLALRKEVGSRWGIASVLGNLGITAYLQGRYGEARALLEQCLAMVREMGDKRGIAMALNLLGNVALAENERASAISHQRAALALACEIGNRRYMSDCLIGIAGTLTLEPATPFHCEEACQLLAVATRYLTEQGAVLEPDIQPLFDQVSQRLKQTLDPMRLAAIQTMAQAISLEDACIYALQLIESLALSPDAS